MPKNSDRDETLLKIRPSLKIEVESTDLSSIQYFQDSALRPILKLQNDFLIQLAKHTLLVRYPDWNQIVPSKKLTLLSSWVSKDLEIKKQIEGSIIGLLTITELAFYFENEREIQRRIRAFVLERIRIGLEVELKSEIS